MSFLKTYMFLEAKRFQYWRHPVGSPEPKIATELVVFMS